MRRSTTRRPGPQARTRRRAGYTLIEIAVSIAIVGLVFALALGTMTSSARPITEASVRAQLSQVGDAAIARLERELQSGDYDARNMVLGQWSAGAFVGLGALTPAPTPTASAAGAYHAQPAIRMFPITGWAGGSVLRGPEVVYRFDGGRLLRRSAGGLELELLRDVLDAPAGDPRRAEFRQLLNEAGTGLRPAVEVRFTLAQRVGRDEWVRLGFSRTIGLRNTQ